MSAPRFARFLRFFSGKAPSERQIGTAPVATRMYGEGLRTIGEMCYIIVQHVACIGTVGGILYWMDFNGLRSARAEFVRLNAEIEAEIERIMMDD